MRLLQPLRPILPLAALAALAACASSPKDPASGSGQPAPIQAWSPQMLELQRGVGTLLLDIDNSLKAWNKLFLTGRDETDRRTARALEEDLAFKATKHQETLIDQLESGPPKNRKVAALALGFSRDKALPSDANVAGGVQRRDPLGPLLAALTDPDLQVQANAAFGIGLLGRSETPMGGLLELMERGEQGVVRSNAAWALRQVLAAGAEPGEAMATARRSLLDAEPGVRSSSALILAGGLAVEAIDDLALQLHDDENLPAVAAASALAHIGDQVPEAKGRCARALTGALPKVRARVRERSLALLQQLSGRNYGQDNDEAWIEWAHRLP